MSGLQKFLETKWPIPVMLIFAACIGFYFFSEDTGQEEVIDPVEIEASKTINSDEEKTSPTEVAESQPKPDLPFDVSAPGFDETVRVKYENTEDLPDAIAFSQALSGVIQLNAIHPDRAVELISYRMKLEETEAEVFRNQLAAINEANQKTLAAFEYEALCSGSSARVFGENVYSAFHLIDEEKDAVTENSYYSLLSELPEGLSARLESWVNEVKLNTTSIRFDYKKRYEFTGRSVDAKAASMCIRMAHVRNQGETKQ